MSASLPSAFVVVLASCRLVLRDVVGVVGAIVSVRQLRYPQNYQGASLTYKGTNGTDSTGTRIHSVTNAADP